MFNVFCPSCVGYIRTLGITEQKLDNVRKYIHAYEVETFITAGQRHGANIFCDFPLATGRRLLAAGRRPSAALSPAVGTGQMSSVETGRMSAAETGQMSAVETRQMSTIATGLCPVLILYICLVSTADICPVSAADICPVSTADICPVSTEDIYPISTEDRTAAGRRLAAALSSAETG